MTENLAGRGEGLAGLVARVLDEHRRVDGLDGRTCACGWQADKVNPKVYDWQHRLHVGEVISALEAAAPAGTAPDVHWAIKAQCAHCVDSYPQRQEGDGYIPNLGPVSDGEWLHHDMVNSSSGAVECAAQYIHEALRAALATPSPQAPQEQCNAFSTTSARGQSAATAPVNSDVALAHSAFKGLSIQVSSGAPPGVALPSWDQHCESALRDEGDLLHCKLKKGHSGPHENGNWEWKDEAEVDASYSEDSPFSVNRAALADAAATQEQPAGSAMDGIRRRLQEFAGRLHRPGCPLRLALSDDFVKGWDAAKAHCAERIESILRNYPDGGSPRKVGEDGDSHLSGRIAARLDEYKFVAQMISGVEKEDWFKRRVANLESMYAASSVPVGEQKQEEGV